MANEGKKLELMRFMRAGAECANEGKPLDESEYHILLAALIGEAQDMYENGDRELARSKKEKYVALGRAYIIGWSQVVSAQWGLGYSAEIDTFPVERTLPDNTDEDEGE